MQDPTVIIAGRLWRVPLLAPRQNRIVIPALLAFGENAGYAALLEIVFAALTRAHASLDRAEFEHWPIPYYELLDALPIVCRQTGMMKPQQSGVPAKAATAPPDWDAIIAQVVNFLPGTTPDYWEDALTAPRLDAMIEEWRKHPPLALLAAAWLGYKPRPRDADAIEDLMRLFPTGKLRPN